jgi:hypothetical protein
MKTEDIHKIKKLLNLVNFGKPRESIREFEGKEIEAVQFELSKIVGEELPLVSIDGSYSILFSFLGADTWIALFRIAVTEYKIEVKNDKIHYLINTPPKTFDHLNLLSFNEFILDAQPEVFSKAAEIAIAFQERNPSLFASNIMSYLEDITLEKISETYNNCILLKDGALLTYKALEREPIYKSIMLNCRTNDILLAGISKSTSTHFFKDNYTDDFFLKRYYNKKYSNLTYIKIPDTFIERQTKFDVWGKIHFAKLHKEAYKWFRIDIGNDGGNIDKLFSSIAAYSMVKLMPGYPIGLIEAHKIAKSVRDFKGSYELELIRVLKDMGLSANDILEGAVDLGGKELSSFHEILDQLSR